MKIQHCMTTTSQSTLLKKAQAVLESNRQAGRYTIPCKGLYPFQWNWDSGFIALGYAHFNFDAALSELNTLLKGQWSNGFIPHIVFQKPSSSYFPGPDFQRADLSPFSTPHVATSGITQPPVLGFVLERIVNGRKTTGEQKKVIEKLAVKIFNNLKYFYDHRDPKKEGLAFIFHNWESGTDNTPVWDEIWSKLDSPNYAVKRKDTTHVDSELRPTKREYDHYLHIIDLAKKWKYDEEIIAEKCPFLIQDPLFNSMLLESNAALVRIFKRLGKYPEKIAYLEEKWEKGRKSMNEKLFSPELGVYVYFDLRNNKKLQYMSSSSFTPLMAKIPDENKAQLLVDTLKNRFGTGHYLCSSFDPTHSAFNPKKYWRGPVWINLNWLIYQGLKSYNFKSLANRVKSETISLIEESGFYEYFDPRKEVRLKERGYGGNGFSWTAALYIDLIHD